MTGASSIDYDALTQDALRGVVRAVLQQIATSKSGLPGEHHFYIAFNTQAPGVVLSRRLREKYPDEMMIVLQHRFWDLAVTDEGFEVKLTFDGIPERLYIPFDALKVFFDPSVRFTLQFGETAEESAEGGRRRRGSDPADRRSRGPRPRPRGAEGSDQQQNTPADAPLPAPTPAAIVPQLSPPPAASPRPTEPAHPPGSATEPAVADAKPAGGAKVFSLEHFRNKKT